MKQYLKKYTRDIGIFNASFCYRTNETHFLFSSAFRCWFHTIFETIFASFVPGLWLVSPNPKNK